MGGGYAAVLGMSSAMVLRKRRKLRNRYSCLGGQERREVLGGLLSGLLRGATVILAGDRCGIAPGRWGQ